MSITLPTSGQTNWDIPLNAALTELDSDVTTISSAIAQIPNLVNRTTGETWYRLVASSGATTNVRNKADYLCDGTDDQVEIQQAVDACLAAGGGVVKLSSGVFNLSAPITLHPTVTLWGQHGDQIFNPNQLTVQSYLKPGSTFTGGAAIVLLGQTAGNYANKSAEQRIFNITIDGTNSAAAVHGIQGSDYIHGVILRDVAIKNATGKGIYTFTENGAQPFSWTMERVVIDNSMGVGIHFINHSDFTLMDTISIGAGGHNYIFSNCPNSRMLGCRAEWSDAHGIYITGNFGTGQGSGGMLISGTSTDRNAFDGIHVDATGNAPILINNVMTRRDGRNNNVGGGGYSGINITNATAPVVLGDITCYPGVDDNGTGVNSPQYGVSVTGSSSVQLENSYLHANAAGVNDGGGNTIFKQGDSIVTATGLTSAPVRSIPNTSNELNWFNVKDYGAKGDNTTDDTAAIQAALTACNAVQGGTVYVPRGNYKISAALTMYNHVRLLGDGDFVTNIVQTSTTANGLIGSSLIYVAIESLRLTGPGSGSGEGIFFTTEFDYCLLRDVTVTDWGSTGIEIEQPIVSNFTRVTSRLNGGAGMYIHGTGLGAGTSISMDSCWSHDNQSNGYSFSNMTYCAMVACAADNQVNSGKAGYLIDGCDAFSLVGCGSEGNNIGIKFNGGTTHAVTGFFCYATPATGIGIYVAGGCTNVQLISIVESLPDGAAAAWIKVDSGCSATVQGSVSTTVNSLAANTTVLAANASGVRSYVNGLSTTALNMNSGKVTSLANGTASGDAVNYSQLSSRSVSVADFGATGGNTGDQAAAINNAIAALSGNGGTVYFPPGIYRLGGSATITLPANTVLQGAGPGASTITLGSSFTGTQAINVTGDGAQIRDLTIRGTASTVATNPVAEGVASVNNQRINIQNCYFKWINGYAIRVYGDTTDTATDGTTMHGGVILNTSIESCAGGVYLRTTNGGAATGVWPANFQVIGLFTRFLGLNSGSKANLDGIRIEDCGDVLLQNVMPWMNAATGGTGAALRVNGNCAAIFIQNLDALGPQTGAANVVIEDGTNGSPQNVQITGGVIQQGSVGLLISGAVNQVRVSTVRILNNQTHGVSVTGTGFGINIDRCLFSLNGQAATGTIYDVNWSGAATGFVTFCRFASPIVTTGTVGVQFTINVPAAQNVRVLEADFQGTGAASTNWVTNFPQILSHVDGTNYQYYGTVVFAFQGAGNVALQPSTTTNNVLSSNTSGSDAFDRFRIRGDGRFDWGPGTATRDTNLYRSGVGALTTDTFFAMGSGQSGGAFNVFGGLAVGTAGQTLTVKGGTNAKAGTVTANGTTAVTVSTTAVTANSTIILSYKSGTQGVGTAWVATLTAGTSFQIKSVAADTAVYNWVIIEQN